MFAPEGLFEEILSPGSLHKLINHGCLYNSTSVQIAQCVVQKYKGALLETIQKRGDEEPLCLETIDGREYSLNFVFDILITFNG